MQIFPVISGGGALPLRLLGLGLGVWMAHSKGRSTVLWGALCFFFPILTIVLALLPRIIRPSDLTRCPECGGPVLRGSGACPKCKSPMPIEMVQCGSCGKFVPAGRSCPDCNPSGQ